MPEPPPFQEAARCDVCKCSFNTFKRRHHCRCCGRTLCNEHSSYQMPLPQFDIHSSVRVCCDCFNNSNRNGRETSQITSDKMDSILNSTSTLSMDEDVNTKDKCTVNNVFDAPECKCGMPLCICEAPIPDPPPTQTRVGITAPSNPRPKKVSMSQQTAESVIRNRGSSSSGRTSLFFNVGQGINNALNDSCTNYEVTGEGLRAAIKNHDILAVKKLLSAGVDANYCDKLGFSLLHLAALFNETEIVFILLDHGASLDCKNAQGETPLECAPTMLQYKIKKKMEERG